MKLLTLLAFVAPVACFGSTTGFVKTHGSRLEVNGAPYRFVGVNFWYGMNLGALMPEGDRPRLIRELDRLKQLGVTNLRVIAGSEGPDSEPWRIVPSLQPSPGHYDQRLTKGFDFLLKEMRRRDMRAVVCLNNFWPWSGGMSQYLAWSGGGPIPYPPPAAGGDWNVYARYTAGFYSNARAMELANQFLRRVVKRHANDPTVMAWELANEPRGVQNGADFNAWIARTAAAIKKLDPNHLVTTGSEGMTGAPDDAGNDVIANHSSPNIDYVTIHIWAQNWSWFDPQNPTATYDATVSKMKEYFHAHVEKARALNKPLVLEEFGLARDNGSTDPTSPTTVRDRYYREIFDEVYKAAASGDPVAGVNFWAWSGEARPPSPGGYWHRGDPFVGDPPHEPQGWYGVYATDASTLKVISDAAGKMSHL